MAMQVAEAELFRELLKSKTVRRSALGGNLAFPVELLHYVWPEGVVPHVSAWRVIPVLDLNRKIWRLECRLRWDNEGRPKPEVHGPAWMDFVREKEVLVGDQLNFYRAPAPPPNEPPIFVIGVKRTIRLPGGHDFLANIN